LQHLLPEPPPPKEVDENKKSNLPEGWKEVFSEEFKKNYYWNEEKQRSQWTVPGV
jgi:hypothetical protein